MFIKKNELGTFTTLQPTFELRAADRNDLQARPARTKSHGVCTQSKTCFYTAGKTGIFEHPAGTLRFPSRRHPTADGDPRPSNFCSTFGVDQRVANKPRANIGKTTERGKWHRIPIGRLHSAIKSLLNASGRCWARCGEPARALPLRNENSRANAATTTVVFGRRQDRDERAIFES